MIAVAGSGLRPRRARSARVSTAATSARKRSCQERTVCQGPKSWGRNRHGQPPLSRHKQALTISRRSVVNVLYTDIIGAMVAHSVSVRACPDGGIARIAPTIVLVSIASLSSPHHRLHRKQQRDPIILRSNKLSESGDRPFSWWFDHQDPRPGGRSRHLVRFVLLPGHRHDIKGVKDLIADVPFKMLLADKAFDAD